MNGRILRKFENRGTKIAHVEFSTVLGSVVIQGDFPCSVHL